MRDPRARLIGAFVAILVLVSGAAVRTQAQGPSTRKPMSLVDLAELPRIAGASPQISPDGDQVIYVLLPFSRAGEHVDSKLWIVSTSGQERPRQFTHGIGRDRSPKWSPDSSVIAFLSDRRTRGPGRGPALFRAGSRQFVRGGFSR